MERWNGRKYKINTTTTLHSAQTSASNFLWIIMISPLGDSVKEFGALSWSYEITFKSNSRELRFEEVRFDKLVYFLIFKENR